VRRGVCGQGLLDGTVSCSSIRIEIPLLFKDKSSAELNCSSIFGSRLSIFCPKRFYFIYIIVENEEIFSNREEVQS